MLRSFAAFPLPALMVSPPEGRLTRKQVRMASLILKRPQSREQPAQPWRPDRAGPGSGVAPVTSWVEPEETLVVDARGGVTPAQRVDQRLLALLGAATRASASRRGACPEGCGGRSGSSTGPAGTSPAEPNLS
jgi:hypothetical protein